MNIQYQVFTSWRFYPEEQILLLVMVRLFPLFLPALKAYCSHVLISFDFFLVLCSGVHKLSSGIASGNLCCVPFHLVAIFFSSVFFDVVLALIFCHRPLWPLVSSYEPEVVKYLLGLLLRLANAFPALVFGDESALVLWRCSAPDTALVHLKPMFSWCWRFSIFIFDAYLYATNAYITIGRMVDLLLLIMWHKCSPSLFLISGCSLVLVPIVLCLDLWQCFLNDDLSFVIAARYRVSHSNGTLCPCLTMLRSGRCLLFLWINIVSLLSALFSIFHFTYQFSNLLNCFSSLFVTSLRCHAR